MRFHLLFLFTVCTSSLVCSQTSSFRVLAFFTAKNDQAHISFVKEAHVWFQAQGKLNGFQYDSTSEWSKMNKKELSKYKILIFLDTRPEESEHRKAFQHYMENGGGFLGFHFSGFALNNSAFPQNWDWYHNEFLGSGEYGSNTWRPTSATLKLENPNHPIAIGLPPVISSAPNEWYRWTNDLSANKSINILLSIDSSSFPLGTGPKLHEIWHNGYYPVVWTNTHYRMVYFNMGHNDIDYENGTNKELSRTFGNAHQDQLILNALKWVARSREK
ncbi:MAG: ThuA domain-containing protein [Chitinophagaceae bacterium]|nr:ThuA domain-containing protein [Chitinophagaceae bacterium]